jgi:hypothetical protein
LRKQAESHLTKAAKLDWRCEADAHCQTARVRLDSAAQLLVDGLLTPVWNHKPPTGESAAVIDRTEDFVAGQSVGYIGYFFTHVRNLLFFATGGLVLLLLTVPSYPFQPPRLLNLFIWVLVLGAVAGVVGVVLQMNRTEVLTNLTGAKQKDLAFDRTLLSPLLRFGALPLFSLIATQFPGIGESLFSWIDPLIRAMK